MKPDKEEKKKEAKAHLKEELREFSIIASYLGICFAFLATVKSLILIQLGIHDFVHGYTVAAVEALGLGKIVLLCHNLPFMKNTLDKRPIVISALVKALSLAVIVFIGGQIEEKIFARHAAEVAMQQRLIMDCTRLFCLVFVFYLMFIWRELNAVLGPGKLKSLLLGARS
ncbi:MAG: hypothetical protein K2Y32_04475 [Candidatus Obscuribacterales bacterium]|uniref:Uncharacterized protein n=1 Tax=Candidatus Obscuribacter phosphatis TaxID=1906157 RepID=A0A8J7PEW7_9BACT|nr:hypothetical protein [Candidatus Obscuribacter phosphatis]MBX9938480.1 hypothetical protein [Candidatus Obscuribacterales bacterium]